jgi:hypothetical protein
VANTFPWCRLEAFYGALSDEKKLRFLVTRRDAATRWIARCRSVPRACASPLPHQGVSDP